VTFDKQRGLGI